MKKSKRAPIGSEKDGERLRIVRRVLGLTQKQMAELFGCSEKTVRSREKGRSPINQQTRRTVFQLSGADIAPLNENEDPLKNIGQISPKYNEASEQYIEASPIGRPSLVTYFFRFRYNNIFRERYLLKPFRHFFENSIRFGQICSTSTFLLEKLQRTFGGWEQNHAYHDALFVGSGNLMVFLIFPAILTVEWGVKARPRWRKADFRCVCETWFHHMKKQTFGGTRSFQPQRTAEMSPECQILRCS